MDPTHSQLGVHSTEFFWLRLVNTLQFTGAFENAIHSSFHGVLVAGHHLMGVGSRSPPHWVLVAGHHLTGCL